MNSLWYFILGSVGLAAEGNTTRRTAKNLRATPQETKRERMEAQQAARGSATRNPPNTMGHSTNIEWQFHEKQIKYKSNPTCHQRGNTTRNPTKRWNEHREPKGNTIRNQAKHTWKSNKPQKEAPQEIHLNKSDTQQATSTKWKYPNELQLTRRVWRFHLVFGGFFFVVWSFVEFPFDGCWVARCLC